MGVYAVRVFQRGQGEASHFWRSDDKVCLYSGSKTYTSLAIGICRDQGRLGLDDPVLGFFPEFRDQASPGSETITLKNLLQMASGKKEFWFAGDPDRKNTSDYAQLFFSDPMRGPAGAGFFYSNACTYMLSRVVEKVTGQTLRDFLVPALFTPLGIVNPQWHTCPRGHTLGATELFLTNQEYSRLGRLLLDGGVYGDQRLVSEAYLREATSEWMDSSVQEEPESRLGYGYQVWRCSPPGVYRADGLYGQFCVVFPDLQTVVTLTSHEEKSPNDLLRLVYNDILPLLG